MNELQRQAYMEAMGVDCYIPRLQLPAAPVSKLCAMPVVALQAVSEPAIATKIVTEPVATGTQSRASGSAAAMQALFNEGDAPVVKKAAVIQADNNRGVKPSTHQEPVPQFALSIVRGNNILLLDEGLPATVDPSEYLQLIQNMLFALGAGKQNLSIDAFIWPMIRNSQVDQSETAARQTLQAFLAKQIDQLGASYMLLMGDIVSQYLVDDALPVGDLIQHPQLPVMVIRSLSAHRMLTEPQLKRDVWQDLQALYESLHHSFQPKAN